MIRVGLVLVELEAAFDPLNRHHQTHDRLLHRIEPPGRHLRRGPGRLGRQPVLEFCAERVDLQRQFVVGQFSDDASQVHGLIEPGRHLVRRDIPVGRHIGIGTSDGQQPGRHSIRQFRQRIMARDVKGHARRAIVGIGEVKRQRGCDRLGAVPCADRPESARFRKAKARGAIGLEHGRRIHFKLLLDVGAARSRPRILLGKGRGMDPAAEATILCADVRPYRESAAAASDEDGRGVDHGRGL